MYLLNSLLVVCCTTNCPLGIIKIPWTCMCCAFVYSGVEGYCVYTNKVWLVDILSVIMKFYLSQTKYNQHLLDVSSMMKPLLTVCWSRLFLVVSSCCDGHYCYKPLLGSLTLSGTGMFLKPSGSSSSYLCVLLGLWTGLPLSSDRQETQMWLNLNSCASPASKCDDPESELIIYTTSNS